MTIKEKIAAMMPLVGTHINLSDPSVSEIAASLGYDYIWIDLEHTRLSCDQLHAHLLACKAGGTPAFVRVPVDDLTTTKHVLELGNVDGIIFPMIQDVNDAKRQLANTLYPPYGTRGCGPKGAVRYGLDDELEYYREGHIKKLCRFVMIETLGAARDAAEIATLPYVDGCIMGMHDLSGSHGHLGDVFCEENMKYAMGAINAFRAAGKSVGISTFASDDETIARYRDMGINLITTGADYGYILMGMRDTLSRARKLQG